MENDTFWKDFVIPFQEEDGDFQFANPVVVAQYFIRAVGTASFLGHQAEMLTEQIGNLRVKLERAKRDLAKFRRRILSRHYSEITKSASSEIQEAFLHKIIHADGEELEFKRLEDEIEALTKELEIREPRLEQYRARLKVLETSMNWSKQYLDFDKLVIRSTNFS